VPFLSQFGAIPNEFDEQKDVANKENNSTNNIAKTDLRKRLLFIDSNTSSSICVREFLQ
jgi:hypothetical protein